jgi:N-acetylglucosaminyldiphosphoundecaprenol N-acetyl-beta-D-mannosaminyltransferase
MPDPQIRLADLPTAHVLGVKISAITLDDLLNAITQIVRRNARARISTMNIHGVNLACESPDYRALVNQCELVVCDGFGLKWGARLLGARLPERLTQADFAPRLAARAAREGFSLFFLGGGPGVAEKAAHKMRERFPNLKIAGTQHGHFDLAPQSAENAAVLRAINAARPNFLFVGLGMPRQDRWLIENWDRLAVNVAMTCGALFTYLSGENPRGPRWMTQHGLEWLFRLMVEPRRLWRRYLLGNPLFLWRVLQQRLGRRRFEG